MPPHEDNTTIAAAAAAVTTTNTTTTDGNDKSSNSLTYIRLVEFEDMALTRGSAPTSTITWLNGNHESAFLVFQKRIEKICSANPWLLGHLVQSSEDGDGKNYIAYNNNNNKRNDHDDDDSTTTTSDVILTHVPVQDSTLSRDIPFSNLAQNCDSFLLKRNNDMNQPFWMVSIVPCSKSPSTTFAVVVSMSHVIGDGHTFYSIYNMLMGGDQAVQVLQVERITETTKLQIDSMGMKEQEIMSSFGFLMCAIRGLLVQKIIIPILGLFGSLTHHYQHRFDLQSRYFMVNPTIMTQLKKQAAAETATTTTNTGDSSSEETKIPFCSSNDVIASWYFRHCGCETGLMAINFRNRLKGHTDAHGGNYENLLYYRTQEDCATPGLIRQSLMKLKRSVTHDNPISVQEMGTGDIAFCTNWASFNNTDQMNLPPGCQQQIHLPIYDLGYRLWRSVSYLNPIQINWQFVLLVHLIRWRVYPRLHLKQVYH